MNCAILLPFLTCTLAAAAPTSTRIKIDTVAAEYRPSTGAERVEPVSMENFYFEVNKETARVRVAVEYKYPDEVGYQSDGDPGPRPTFAQLQGLTYDPAAHSVVYSRDGKRTVCAVVQEKRGVFGAHLSVRSTGSCMVTTAVADHAKDDGWSIHRFRAVDIYFEVR